MVAHAIFDLDGTLIDSSSSILASFASAFEALGITPTRPLTAEIIGPPLMQTLALLSGSDDQAQLQALAQKFKAHYDDEGCKQATVFAGVVQMLEHLSKSDAALYIATNKRLYPTLKIMQHLGWEHYFAGIYALDYYNPPVPSKKHMVGRILADHHIDASSAIYIGDRVEDGLAADDNALEFAMVTWGYVDHAAGEIPAHWRLYHTPDELSARLSA